MTVVSWQLKKFTRFAVCYVTVSLFMHPDQAQNTSSGIQGQEATAVAVILRHLEIEQSSSSLAYQ